MEKENVICDRAEQYRRNCAAAKVANGNKEYIKKKKLKEEKKKFGEDGKEILMWVRPPPEVLMERWQSWSIAPVLKTGDRETGPRVRIPPSPRMEVPNRLRLSVLKTVKCQKHVRVGFSPLPQNGNLPKWMKGGNLLNC